jgi:hypothetical protein
MSYLSAFSIAVTGTDYVLSIGSSTYTSPISSTQINAYEGNSSYFYFGELGLQTLLDYSLCSSPTAASRALLITAIQALANTVDETFGSLTLTDASNQLIVQPGGTGTTFTITGTNPASSRVFTLQDVASSNFVMSEGAQTVNGVKTFGSGPIVPSLTLNATVPWLILNPSGGATAFTITCSAPASSRTFTLPDVATSNFVMSEGTQGINGSKTFGSSVAVSPTSNQLVLGAIRTVTITAPTPATSSRTHTIPDVSGDASFVMTEAAQTINGVKTFSSGINLGNTTFSSYIEASTFATAPELLFGGANTGMTYTVRRHRYTKIGNVYFVEVYLIINALGSSTGVASVSNFPGTFPATNTGVQLTASVGGVDLSANNYQVVAAPSGGTSTVLLYQTGDNVNGTQLSETAFANGDGVQIYGFYSV